MFKNTRCWPPKECVQSEHWKICGTRRCATVLQQLKTLLQHLRSIFCCEMAGWGWENDFEGHSSFDWLKNPQRYCGFICDSPPRKANVFCIVDAEALPPLTFPPGFSKCVPIKFQEVAARLHRLEMRNWEQNPFFPERSYLYTLWREVYPA